MEERWRLRSGEDWLALQEGKHRVVPRRLEAMPRAVWAHPAVNEAAARMQKARKDYHRVRDNEFATEIARANAKEAYMDAHRDLQDTFERVSREFLTRHEVWVYGPRLHPFDVVFHERGRYAKE